MSLPRSQGLVRCSGEKGPGTLNQPKSAGAPFSSSSVKCPFLQRPDWISSTWERGAPTSTMLVDWVRSGSGEERPLLSHQQCVILLLARSLMSTIDLVPAQSLGKPFARKPRALLGAAGKVRVPWGAHSSPPNLDYAKVSTPGSPVTWLQRAKAAAFVAGTRRPLIKHAKKGTGRELL
ncbi:putative tubulin polyglutamylase TTLL9 [Platysternon megacephalum]|uniref:Putative tubulin polyglutamylase TTLL9 n=1 Tax=Platysternon megacephalum TaxID=55544 RepID=A0A4D9E976_9SAUR|nr:putative tubulin polyglutamylase TTLL9 [Platysternon megacephalum]